MSTVIGPERAATQIVVFIDYTYAACASFDSLAEDMRAATALDLRAIPAILVNGQLYEGGLSPLGLRQVVETPRTAGESRSRTSSK